VKYLSFINGLSGPNYIKEKEVQLYIEQNTIEHCLKPNDFFSEPGEEVTSNGFLYTALIKKQIGGWVTAIDVVTNPNNWVDELNIDGDLDYDQESGCTVIDRYKYPGFVPGYMLDVVRKEKWFIDETFSPKTYEGMIVRLRCLYMSAMSANSEEKLNQVKIALLTTIKII
jgi:hypothetical protein